MQAVEPRSESSLRGLRVLVVDDEKNIRRTLTLCLEDLGCEVVGVGTAEMALTVVAQRPFEIAFLDLKLGESSGLDLLPKLLAENPDLAAVVLTAYATFDTAVEAIKPRGGRLPAETVQPGSNSSLGRQARRTDCHSRSIGRTRSAAQVGGAGDRARNATRRRCRRHSM